MGSRVSHGRQFETESRPLPFRRLHLDTQIPQRRAAAPWLGGTPGPSGIVLASIVVALVLVSSFAVMSTGRQAPGPNGGAVHRPGGPAIPAGELQIPGPAASLARPGEHLHSAVGGPPIVEWYNVTSTASTSLLEQPPHLFGASMAYDPGDPTHTPPPAAGLLLLFGGGTPWGLSNFTYVGIPTTTTAGNGVVTPSIQWVNLSAQLPVAPSPRYYASMAYDAIDGYVVLFGGQNGTTFFDDTWTIQITGAIQNGLWVFYTTGWVHRIERTTPSLRAGAQMAYDPIDQDVVLYGGEYGTQLLGDTWDFFGGSWTQLTSPTSPPVDGHGALVPDGAGGVLLITGRGLLSQAWTFVGGTWNLISTTVPLGGAAYVGVSYDNATGNLTLFGGMNLTTLSASNATWNATADLGVWSQPVTGAAPADRAYASMVYDPAIGLTVLFGGGGPVGPLNDTWVFGSWPRNAFPFSVTLAFYSSAFGPENPPFQPGSDVYFIATPNGGTAPYSYYFSSNGAASVYVAGSGSVTVMFSFSSPANYLLTVIVGSGGLQATANLTIPVGSIMVPNWQPLRDFYSFPNSGSVWSPGGNCWGFATTAILYWDHDIAGEADTPYLPAPVYSTFNLSEPPGNPPSSGPGMNSTTLAIMMHQTLEAALVTTTSISGASMAADLVQLENQLALGNPVILVLHSPQHGYHAVVAYGVWTAPNGTVEITTSDSNEPNTTDLGYWIPASENFTYYSAGAYVNGFTYSVAAPAVSTIQPSWLKHWMYTSDSQSYDTQGNGWELVASDAALKIVSTAGGSDSFAFPSLGDSQTFLGGIANSSGIEEPFQIGPLHGVMQVYALPLANGVGYGIKDPSNNTSDIELVQATNDSGTPTVRGATFTVSSEGEHAVNLTAEPNGTRLVVGNESVSVNVSFAQLVGNVSDVLNASSLTLPAYSLVGFHVENWSGLASTSANSIEVSVSTDNGTGATTTYHLTNGQSGLGPGTLVAFTVTFTETGLTTKELAKPGWSVEVGGVLESTTTATTLSFNLANGTYPYLVMGPAGDTVLGNPAGGTLTVAGAAQNWPFTFAKGKTAVLTFTAKGLAVDRNWCVEVSGLTLCSTGKSVKFPALALGPYDYAVVSPLAGQTVTGNVGKTTAVLTGGSTQTLDLVKSTTVALTFAYEYAVTFAESGLTSGTWSITVKGHTETAAWDRAIQFNLTNGTYAYKIGGEMGYIGTGSPARAVVPTSVSVTVTFTKKA